MTGVQTCALPIFTDVSYDPATGAMVHPDLHAVRAPESHLQQYLDDARQRFEAASEWSDVGPDPGQTSDEFEHLRWFDLPAPSLRR